MHQDVKKILISEEEIELKSKELGQEITDYYKNHEEPPILVALLKGTDPFNRATHTCGTIKGIGSLFSKLNKVY